MLHLRENPVRSVMHLLIGHWFTGDRECIVIFTHLRILRDLTIINIWVEIMSRSSSLYRKSAFVVLLPEDLT